MQSVIFGCGDIGRRIAKFLIQSGVPSGDITAYVNSVESAELCARLQVLSLKTDLDNLQKDLAPCHGTELYYTVPPQKSGSYDARSETLLDTWRVSKIKPAKVVLISTTGVYGDCDGEWVDEESPTTPQTDRGKRRLSAEVAWLSWGREQDVPVVILRVPGIYAYSRLPRERLLKRTPVVRPHECGYSNRIHADDLARICVAAMRKALGGEVFNATDGSPGRISEYLQAAAHVLGMEPLPEISMDEAQSVLSAGMLSYLSESRKISNKKLLSRLDIDLLYPDFLQGLKE